MQKLISKENLILKKLRELKGLTRQQAAILLATTDKNIEKMENGRAKMTGQRIFAYLAAYGISSTEYELCLTGKIHLLEKKYRRNIVPSVKIKKPKRNYLKIITPDVKTLKDLRRMRGVSQKKASYLCGYERQSIGHIENGRIELPRNRIEHIVHSYGFTMDDFERHKNSNISVADLQDGCITIIKKLHANNLNVAHTFLKTINKNA